MLMLSMFRYVTGFDENLIKIVEVRLDVALYRICYFPTIFPAKQWRAYEGHARQGQTCICNAASALFRRVMDASDTHAQHVQAPVRLLTVLASLPS